MENKREMNYDVLTDELIALEQKYQSHFNAWFCDLRESIHEYAESRATVDVYHSGNTYDDIWITEEYREDIYNEEVEKIIDAIVGCDLNKVPFYLPECDVEEVKQLIEEYYEYENNCKPESEDAYMQLIVEVLVNEEVWDLTQD